MQDFLESVLCQHRPLVMARNSAARSSKVGSALAGKSLAQNLPAFGFGRTSVAGGPAFHAGNQIVVKVADTETRGRGAPSLMAMLAIIARPNTFVRGRFGFPQGNESEIKTGQRRVISYPLFLGNASKSASEAAPESGSDIAATDIVLPFILEGGHILVEASLDGHASRTFFFDSGSRTIVMLDTAAAIDGLDLVIMTGRAVAHLAGAMGKPV